MAKRRSPKIGWKAKVKVRLRRKDAHYSGGLVAGGKVLELFGDAATELCLRETRGKDEGLFRAYESVDFLKPLYAGNRIVVTARIIKLGHTSRKMKFTCYRTRPRRQLTTHAVGT